MKVKVRIQGNEEEVQALKSRFNTKGEYIPRNERKDETTKSKPEVKEVKIEYDEASHTWTEEKN